MGASGTTRTTKRPAALWVGLAVSLMIGLGSAASYASRPGAIIDYASAPLAPGASAHIVVNATGLASCSLLLSGPGRRHSGPLGTKVRLPYIEWSWRLPRNAAPGVWRATVRCLSDGKGRVYRSSYQDLRVRGRGVRIAERLAKGLLVPGSLRLSFSYRAPTASGAGQRKSVAGKRGAAPSPSSNSGGGGPAQPLTPSTGLLSPGYHVIANSSQVNGAEISGNGRYVVFWSCGGIAGVLAASCSSDPSEPSIDQVYETDLETGQTSLVSAAEGGGAGNGWSGSAVVSQNGRYVAFFSDASDLESAPAGSSSQLYERDMTIGATTLVSVNSSGSMGENAEPNGFPPAQPAISANGEYVAFATSATNLLATPTANEQVFERDVATGVTTLVSQGLGSEWIAATHPAISTDGRYVAFATHTIANFHGCGVAQRDTNTNTTRWVSGPANGLYCDENASVSMSATGQFVGYNTDVLLSGGSVEDCGKYQGHATACIPAFETDLSAGSTQLVTGDLEGGLAGGLSGVDGVSEDGQYILAYSNAEDIVPESISISLCLLTCRFGMYVFDQQTKAVQVLRPPTPEYPESYQSVATAGIDEAGDRVAFVSCPSVCQWVYIWNR